MKIENNELLFIYNSENLQDREAFGYAKAQDKYAVKELDITKDPLTEQQLAEIANRLKASVAKLLNEKALDKKDDPLEHLSEEDLLKELRHNPMLLKTPIVVYHDQAEFVESPFKFIKKGMASKDIKSDKANFDN